MKTTSIVLCAIVLSLIVQSCKKDAAAEISSSNSSSTFNATAGSIIGRQRVISLATGDYYYPTSQALLWLPVNYNDPKYAKNQYPLIIALGGVGQNGSSDISIVLNGETVAKRISEGWNAEAVNPITKTKQHFIVFSPEKPEPNSWGWNAPAIKKMLTELEATYRINPSRIYITGLSAGGWGLWSCITDDTSLCKKFAAIGPVSSAGADHPSLIPNVDKYNIACWNICGTADTFYSYAVDYTGIIKNNHPKVQPVLTGLNGVGHSAWDYAYDPTWTQNGINFYQWLLQFSRK